MTTATQPKQLKDIPQSDLSGQRVLVRVDLNVPLKNGVVQDDTRIDAIVPTVRYLTAAGAKVVLLSHLGRPKGAVVPELSLSPVSKKLSEKLGHPVNQADDCVGDGVSSMVADLEKGGVLLLENLRFHAEETQNDPEFAKKLASHGDLFVQDAFGVAHRSHASTVGIPSFLPSVSGFLLGHELAVLQKATTTPDHPYVAIVGGAKISSKLGVLKRLAEVVDTLIIGGGMCYTLMKAQGQEIGTSLVENDLLDEAKSFLEFAKNGNCQVVLPEDHICVAAFDNEAVQTVASTDTFPADQMGVDIGPKSIETFKTLLSDAKTVLWNGPLGVFECPNFAKGTNAIATLLADTEAFTIIGGGDSAAAIAKAGLSEKMDHISTGGGAALEYLQGDVLAGVASLGAA